ncbi:MAG: SEC-C domain-containing protein [Ktedonobacteraceae bacterium]|nr:SEC-C domain-containing protein [Ktedonobacteraceae bacterium]
MFENLKQAIQHYIVDSLLKLLRNDFTIAIQRPEPQRKAARNLRTNVDEIAKASGQAKSDAGDERSKTTPRRRNTSRGKRATAVATTAAPTTSTSAIQKVGRNDPCPCGSGKKYKKCHGA